MCDRFLPDEEDQKLLVQIKCSFNSLMDKIKSFISGESKNVIVAKSNDNELAIANSVGKVRLNV